MDNRSRASSSGSDGSKGSVRRWAPVKTDPSSRARDYATLSEIEKEQNADELLKKDAEKRRNLSGTPVEEWGGRRKKRSTKKRRMHKAKTHRRRR